ncbi:hypothetical protein [Novosphingobium aquimarinum]|uniref:hypothetical protein n=1 Tax=Novosphingobium aquimarinum TaxID=2682494 RepID=UPI0012EC1244|nr:hypothetical protein [Novosphingobium aquimarinum]
MNYPNAHGTPRRQLSLRLGAIPARTLTNPAPIAAMIPTTELRRLVATMVD